MPPAAPPVVSVRTLQPASKPSAVRVCASPSPSVNAAGAMAKRRPAPVTNAAPAEGNTPPGRAKMEIQKRQNATPGRAGCGDDDDELNINPPHHAVPVASARPDQHPKEMASQPGPGGPWPTGARWRVLGRATGPGGLCFANHSAPGRWIIAGPTDYMYKNICRIEKKRDDLDDAQAWKTLPQLCETLKCLLGEQSSSQGCIVYRRRRHHAGPVLGANGRWPDATWPSKGEGRSFEQHHGGEGGRRRCVVVFRCCVVLVYPIMTRSTILTINLPQPFAPRSGRAAWTR